MDSDDINLSTLIELLMKSLRDEISQRGELLLLQQGQQELIINRKVPELVASATEMFGLEKKLTESRQASEQAKESMVTKLGLPQETKFEQMISQLPEEYRPVMEALRAEVNVLQQKLEMWLKYNTQFLKRANILIEGIMQNAAPEQTSQAPHECVVDLYGRPSPKGTLYEGVI